MAAQVLLTQKEVAAIQYAVLGNSSYTTATAFDSIAGQFRAGTLTQESYINNLISSAAGQTLYSGKTELDILKSVYMKAYGSAPSDTVLQASLDSGNLASSISSAINNLLNYNGFDSATLTSQQNFDNALNKMMYQDYGTTAWSQWSNALSTKEMVASAYLSLAGRSADMTGLDFWTTVMLQPGRTFDFLLGRLISSSEVQSKGASLTGDSYINYVYKAIYGVDASSTALNTYRALGTALLNKSNFC
ncbi:hypothetical protein ACPUGT_04090 [Klebsiella aerogenes]|uniref:hypothetical protein n=1 Tax=Klebsiella aerogenes TaxID=548 RepID=UPI003D34B055